MTVRDRTRLADIADAIATIRSHIGRGPLSDGLIFDAVRVRLIEIGEAVKGLSDDVKALEPQVPWREIARMRDLLTHRYFDTDYAMVESTVADDLTELAAAVERLALRCADRG